jgi:hypothetical protein
MKLVLEHLTPWLDKFVPEHLLSDDLEPIE